MPSSLISLQILVILLPGFAASTFVKLLSAQRKQTDLERVIEALQFSFVIYVFFALWNGGQLPFHFVPATSVQGETIQWDGWPVAKLGLLTFLVGAAFAKYLNDDGNRIFRLFDTKSVGRGAGWGSLI